MCFHLGKFKQSANVQERDFLNVEWLFKTVNYFLVVMVTGTRTSKSWTTFQQSVFILQMLTGGCALSFPLSLKNR